ncbi:MAG: glycogen debranching enzyme, partial [Acidimicrobiales bacterium]
FNWDLTRTNSDLVRFTSLMIALRKRFAALRRPSFFGSRVNERGLPEITWHGPRLYEPEWGNPDARALAVTLAGFDGEADLHAIFNMADSTIRFDLPEIPDHVWARAADTALPTPEDVAAAGAEQPVDDIAYLATGRSVVVLISHDRAERQRDAS